MPVEGESSLSLRLEAIKRDRLRVQFLSLLKLFQKLLRSPLQCESNNYVAPNRTKVIRQTGSAGDKLQIITANHGGKLTCF